MLNYIIVCACGRQWDINATLLSLSLSCSHSSLPHLHSCSLGVHSGDTNTTPSSAHTLDRCMHRGTIVINCFISALRYSYTAIQQLILIATKPTTTSTTDGCRRRRWVLDQGVYIDLSRVRPCGSSHHRCAALVSP